MTMKLAQINLQMSWEKLAPQSLLYGIQVETAWWRMIQDLDMRQGLKCVFLDRVSIRMSTHMHENDKGEQQS